MAIWAKKKARIERCVECGYREGVCAEMSELSDDQYSDLEWVDDHAFPFINQIIQPTTKSAGSGKRSMQSVVRPRQGQLYDNCIVESMEGVLLCRISRKRCLWYVNRQLADIVQDHPELIIRLKFVAKGGPRDDDLFPLSAKQNICVRCGQQNNLLRAYVVPHCYRREFPKKFSSHQSHDITLLCVSCYEIWAQAHAALRNQISTEFVVPIDGVRVGQAPDQKRIQIVQTARTLLKYRTIPQDKRKQLLRTVADYNGWQELPSDQMLIDFADSESTDDNRPLIPHGRLVIQAVADLPEFIRRWRTHFVESLQPKYLPEHWNVDYGLTEETH